RATAVRIPVVVQRRGKAHDHHRAATAGGRDRAPPVQAAHPHPPLLLAGGGRVARAPRSVFRGRHALRAAALAWQIPERGKRRATEPLTGATEAVSTRFRAPRDSHSWLLLRSASPVHRLSLPQNACSNSLLMRTIWDCPRPLTKGFWRLIGMVY